MSSRIGTIWCFLPSTFLAAFLAVVVHPGGVGFTVSSVRPARTARVVISTSSFHIACTFATADRAVVVHPCWILITPAFGGIIPALVVGVFTCCPSAASTTLATTLLAVYQHVCWVVLALSICSPRATGTVVIDAISLHISFTLVAAFHAEVVHPFWVRFTLSSLSPIRTGRVIIDTPTSFHLPFAFIAAFRTVAAHKFRRLWIRMAVSLSSPRRTGGVLVNTVSWHQVHLGGTSFAYGHTFLRDAFISTGTLGSGCTFLETNCVVDTESQNGQ